MSKMASHEHLQPKLWAKERPKVKLAVWLSTTKNSKSTRFRSHQVECHMALESSRRELQDWFRPHPNYRSEQEVWMPKVSGVQIGTISGLLGSPGKKCHSNVTSTESCKEYYMGEGGGFPWVRAVVNQVNPCCPWLVPTPKVIENVI
jgi:hypothetical protein